MGRTWIRSACLAPVLVAVLGFARIAGAQTETAGHEVAPDHAGIEASPSIIADGLGGAFVGFHAYASAPYPPAATYVSRVNASGARVDAWAPTEMGGLTTYWEMPSGLASPAPGRVWAAANEHLQGNPDFIARKITAGEFGFATPGASLALNPTSRGSGIYVLPDGRCLLAGRGGSFGSGGPSALVYAFIDAAGALTEVPSQPVPGSWYYLPYHSTPPSVVPDGNGGAWVVTEFCDLDVQTNINIAAQRITATGDAVLSPAFRMVCTSARNQDESVIASDGGGGVYIAWADRRNLGTSIDLYGTHLAADGSSVPGWPAQGKAIASFAGDQTQPCMVADGAGGIWLVWTDSRAGVNDIYYTHLGPDGSSKAGFVAGGQPLCAAAGSQIDVKIAADGEGGFYAVWSDERDGELDLYAQHIHATGIVMPGWAPDGLPVCTEGTAQESPVLLVTSPHHALAAWVDSRSGLPKTYATELPADDAVAGVGIEHPASLALAPARNPSRDGIELLVNAPDAAPIVVTLLDVSGRVQAEQVVSGPARDTRIRFEASRPGLYFLRASQHGVLATTRVALAH